MKTWLGKEVEQLAVVELIKPANLCQIVQGASTELQIRCLVPLIIREDYTVNICFFLYNIIIRHISIWTMEGATFWNWNFICVIFVSPFYLNLLFKWMFPCVLISAKSLHVGVAMFLLDFLDAALLQSLINSWWMFVKIFLQNEPLGWNSFTTYIDENLFRNHVSIQRRIKYFQYFKDVFITKVPPSFHVLS